MKPSAVISLLLFLCVLPASRLRADLILEQQSSDTNRTITSITTLHGSKMRMDQPSENLSVIIDLKTRDSYTLLTKDKQFLQRFGSEVRWAMDEERKHTQGTNEVDAPPAPAVDSGKSELVEGYQTEIYTWVGAYGLQEKLWVAKDFPNFAAIRPELAKLDKFNDGGPHRNSQPLESGLPGMVLKAESSIRGHTLTNTLVSAKVEPVDDSLFVLPKGYKAWKSPKKDP